MSVGRATKSYTSREKSRGPTEGFPLIPGRENMEED